MKSIFLLWVVLAFIANLHAQKVGIGTNNPGSGFELKGNGLGAQQRITDALSGNSLVLQGGASGNLKITGYNYTNGTAQPLYLSVDGANTYINHGGGNVGIGTNTPANKLTVNSVLYGIEHTDGSVRLATFLNSSGAWIGTLSNHPLNFYTNDGPQLVTINQSGQVGIGTTTPLAGYLLDVNGPVRTFGNSTHFVAQTTGGTNSWARLYLRSAAQSWFIGTSQNFNGNQLYIADETFSQTRFSIQPASGRIYATGHIQQDLGSYGLPKAMLYVNGDGAIIRCYNAITNSTTGNCGFSVSKSTSGSYNIGFGFDISTRFISLSVQDLAINNPVGISHGTVSGTGISVYIYETHQGGLDFTKTDRPFMVIVY
jgi:hypothetical protein